MEDALARPRLCLELLELDSSEKKQMRYLRLVTFTCLWLLLLLSPFATQAEDHAKPKAADKPAKVNPSDVVGSVFGKPVTAAGVGLKKPIDKTLHFDSRNNAQWELMGRIMKAFGTALRDRFVKEQKIEATAEEIDSFMWAMRKSRTNGEGLRSSTSQSESRPSRTKSSR